MELANAPTATLQNLVDGLNVSAGACTYAYGRPGWKKVRDEVRNRLALTFEPA